MSIRSLPMLILVFLCLCTASLAAQQSEIVCALKELETEDLESSTPSRILNSGILSVIYSGLVDADERSEFKPDLAERWEVSADGLTWTFTLRDHVTFHDGTPLEASDVAAVFNRILDPSNDALVRTIYRMVKSVTAEGTRIVKVRLTSPYGPLPYLMLRSIMPGRPPKGTPVPPGTGPFKLVSLTANEAILDANAEYFGGRPKVDRLVFRSYPDQKKAWVALLQGAVDAVTDLELEDYRLIRNDARFRTWELLDSFCYSIIFNVRDPLLSQPGIRKAISAAIDRDDLIELALEGAGARATGPFLPGSAFADPDPTLQAYDLARAKQLLADLRWKDVDGDWVLEKADQELVIRILVDAGDTAKEAATKRLQWQLLQAGIKAEFEFLEAQQLFGERLMPGRFQAVFLQTNAFGDPDQPLSAFWHSASVGRSNLAGYRNPELDRLIAQGQVTADPALRREIYRRCHRILAEDAPAAFLFVKKRFSATSARIGGVAPSLDALYNLSLIDWYIVDTSTGGR